MAEEAFRQGVPLVEKELQIIKRILEQGEYSLDSAGCPVVSAAISFLPAKALHPYCGIW